MASAAAPASKSAAASTTATTTAYGGGVACNSGGGCDPLPSATGSGGACSIGTSGRLDRISDAELPVYGDSRDEKTGVAGHLDGGSGAISYGPLPPAGLWWRDDRGAAALVGKRRRADAVNEGCSSAAATAVRTASLCASMGIGGEDHDESGLMANPLRRDVSSEAVEVRGVAAPAPVQDSVELPSHKVASFRSFLRNSSLEIAASCSRVHREGIMKM